MAFPSPDSDFDLRGVHLLPLEEVVGLKTGRETVEKSGIHDGMEIDLVTHDAKKFFGLMLKKNGYVMEQVLSPLIVHTTPEHEELKSHRRRLPHEAPRPSLPRLRRHAVEAVPEGKPATGQAAAVRLPSSADRHSPDASGEIEANLVHLNETFKLPYLPELIERKVSGTEKGTLDEADLVFHEQEYERLRTELEEAFEQSDLPEQPSGAAALNDLLVRLRLGERK